MAHKQGYGPDLRKYLNLKVDLKMNGNRNVVGTLIGYDQFMNVVLDHAEEVTSNSRKDLGSVFIRGNTVVMWECLDKITS